MTDRTKGLDDNQPETIDGFTVDNTVWDMRTKALDELIAGDADLYDVAHGKGRIMLEMAKASDEDLMWRRRWEALRSLNYHNTHFSDRDGKWTMEDFIAYAGGVCGFQKPASGPPDASARITGDKDRRESQSSAPTEPAAWQPIETAPKDGVFLLGLPLVGNLREGDRRVYEGRWDDEQKTFTSVNGFILLSAATHWMPLPAPPA